MLLQKRFVRKKPLLLRLPLFLALFFMAPVVEAGTNGYEVLARAAGTVVDSPTVVSVSCTDSTKIAVAFSVPMDSTMMVSTEYYNLGSLPIFSIDWIDERHVVLNIQPLLTGGSFSIYNIKGRDGTDMINYFAIVRYERSPVIRGEKAISARNGAVLTVAEKGPFLTICCTVSPSRRPTMTVSDFRGKVLMSAFTGSAVSGGTEFVVDAGRLAAGSYLCRVQAPGFDRTVVFHR